MLSVYGRGLYSVLGRESEDLLRSSEGVPTLPEQTKC